MHLLQGAYRYIDKVMKVDEQIPVAVFAHLLPLLIGAAENLSILLGHYGTMKNVAKQKTKTDVADHKKLVFAA